MLKINKSININGSSTIGDIQVAYFNASISTDGKSNANINISITNQELYSKHKDEVRADMADFSAEVHRVEDEVLGGNL